MQRIPSRRSISMTPIGWGVVWLGLGLLLATWPAAVLGQEPPPAGEVSDFEEDSFWFSDRITGRSEQSLGALIRGGFINGPAVGRENSLFPLEFMPYSMWGNGMLFGDLRGFRDTRDHYGANVGLGYRYYIPALDRIIGGYGFYDYDNTSTKLFRQISFGLETYGAAWDMRLNTYFPIQTESKLLQTDLVADSVRFSGNNILYNQLRTLGTPMKGLEHEFGTPLPGRFAVRHDVRVFAGWYLFDGEGVDHTLGWKGRLQGYLTPNVSMGLEVTNDQQFDTNVVFSVAFGYGGYREPDDRPASQFSRMTTPVQRLYNVVIARTGVLDIGLTATKPDGTPYFIEHVASSDPYDRTDLALMLSLAPQFDPLAAPGTFENPFEAIADAQAAPGGDIIYTWTNSVYTATAVDVNESNVRILGEGDGVVHSIQLEPFGFVAMPRAVNNPDPAVAELRPLFRDIIGDGVTLTANDSEFSGFRIGDAGDATSGPTGNGIFGTTVNNVTLRQVDVNFAQLDGVRLEQVSNVDFFQTRIFNAAGTGLHIIGGRPFVTFEGDGDRVTGDIVYSDTTIAGGHAVIVEDTLAGSFVDLFGANPSSILYTNAGGVVVQNSSGSVRFGDISISNTVATLPEGINLLNDAGAYTFSSPIVLNNTAGDGINIENLAATGIATFLESVTITDRGERGVDLLNIAGNGDPARFSVTFRDDLDITTALPVNYSGDPAIDYRRTDLLITQSGNVAFQDISIDGGNGQGIVVGVTNPNVDGQFVVRGLTDISDIALTNINIEDDTTVTFSGVTIDDRGFTTNTLLDALRIVNNTEPITFNGRTLISNGLVSGGTAFFDSVAVVIFNNSIDAPVSFESLTVTDAYNGSPLPFLGTGTPSDIVAGVAVGTDGFGGDQGNPGLVIMDQLSISTLGTPANNIDNNGVALGARFVGTATTIPVTGGLFVDSGIIDSIFASAVDVQASVIGLTFDSVSAELPLGPGILLANNLGGANTTSFTVLGTGPAALFPGGTITGALPYPVPIVLRSQTVGAPVVTVLAPTSGAGVLQRNSGAVVLNGMQIDANMVGIDVATDAAHLGLAGQTDSLFLDDSTVQTNLTFGLNALNVQTLTVTDSTFIGNGPGFFGTDDNEIRSQANLRTSAATGLTQIYTWLFDNNTISDADNSAVLLQTFGAGSGAQLNLTFTDNTVTTLVTTAVVSADLDITWNGVLNAVIDNNTLRSLGPLDRGVSISTTSTTALATVDITNNDFQGTGLANVGFDISAQGPSSYLIENNVMQQSNTPLAAMQFFLAPNSTTTIRNNLINILGEQSEGLIFTSVTAPATVRIEGNDITINGTDLLLDEIGIDFQATTGTINFFGDFDNIVTIDGFNGFNFPYFNFPINGQFNGSILVNGAPHP